jgi:hypothetical protein
VFALTLDAGRTGRSSTKGRLLLGLVLTLGVLALLPSARAQAACSAIAFGGAPTAASISVAGESDCYTFPGAVGDQIRIRVVETSGSLFLATNVQRPNLTTVCANDFNVDRTCTLDAAGTHQINVQDNAGTNTGNYSIVIQRLNGPTGCTALSFGAAPAPKTVSAAAQMDCYTFAGAVGDQIRVRVVRKTGSINELQELVRPDGTTRCTPTSAQEVTCQLDAVGTHTLVLRDSNGINLGDYAISIQRLNNPTGCTALSPGAAPTTKTVSAAGQMDCFDFTAGATGDRWRIRLVETGGAIFELGEVVGPDGLTTCASTGSTSSVCTTDGSGVHHIIVRDNSGANTGDYSISVQKLNGPTGCSAPAYGAGPLNKTLSVAAQQDCLVFSGSPGDRIRIRVVKKTGTITPIHEVFHQDGTPLCGATSSQETTCRLDAFGNNRMIIDDSAGINTGDYAVSVQKLNAPVGCTALSPGAAPITKSIVATGQMDCWTFAGTLGDQVRVRVTESSGTIFAQQEVVRPSGTTVCGLNGNQDATCTLSSTGTHTVLVRDNSGTNLGNYRISIQILNNPTGCSAQAFGPNAAIKSIGGVSETDCYTFPGAAGDEIRAHLVKTSGSVTPTQEVIRPNGTTMCGSTTSQDVTCELDVAGTYTVLVHDSLGTNTGGYALGLQRLNSPVGCTVLAVNGAPQSKSIGGTAQMPCFTFAAAVGDVYRVRLPETSGTMTLLQEVIDPSGAPTCSATSTMEVDCPTDVAGTHVILVHDSAGTNLGNFSIATRKLNSSSGCTALAIGALPAAMTTTAAAEMKCFSFSGTTGDRIRVRTVKTAGAWTPSVDVVRPNGTTVCGPTTAQHINCKLDTTGAYRIIVNDNGGSLFGDAVTSVQDLTAPSGCTAIVVGGGLTAASIGTAGETDCYTFAGTAGQHITSHVVETSGSLFALQEIVRPSGVTECGASGATDLGCVLSTSGTFKVVVYDSSGPTTGNYSISEDSP